MRVANGKEIQGSALTVNVLTNEICWVNPKFWHSKGCCPALASLGFALLRCCSYESKEGCENDKDIHGFERVGMGVNRSENPFNRFIPSQSRLDAKVVSGSCTTTFET